MLCIVGLIVNPGGYCKPHASPGKKFHEINSGNSASEASEKPKEQQPPALMAVGPEGTQKIYR